ncbi:hypothetical protein BDV26DRAFT_190977 [Aspergillus bertholletiae]|uniref:PLC-like phosphodiesterase n=1 Tax=Aspergillus bertholletiae TaxID=1226010 RepID=A0A5N7B9C6_9EURO|nr:hypothetical protein BDV26DRAFT_190977 [Aspergillus bertholletiae]
MAAMKEPDLLNSTPSLQDKEYDSYSWELLDDHPLRSHPAECIPGLTSYVARHFAFLRKQWTELVFPLVCLFLMFLIVIQFVAALPFGLTYIIFRSGIEEQKGFLQWPAELRREPSTCILYNPQAQDAVQYAINAGCSGAKVDLRVQGVEFLVGSVSDPKASGPLDLLYINPLVKKLDARNPIEISPTSPEESDPMGLFDEDPAQPFMLFLDLHTSAQAAWPHLVSQLMPLKQKGYLSYRNGTRVIPRPVTIVLTGLDTLDFSDVVGSDHGSIADSIMFDASLEQFAKEDYGSSSREPQSSRSLGGSNSASTEADTTSGLKQHHDSSYQLLTATANFTRSIGFPHRGGRFSPQQIARVRTQVRAAHRRGLRARYEGVSNYPPAVRRMIWRILVREGADIVEFDGRRCKIPWWRRFFVAGGMECRGQKGDTGSV